MVDRQDRKTRITRKMFNMLLESIDLKEYSNESIDIMKLL